MSVNNLKEQTEEFTSTGAKTNPSAPRGPILIAGVYATVTALDYFKAIDDKDETDTARIEAAKEVFSKEDVDPIVKIRADSIEAIMSGKIVFESVLDEDDDCADTAA